MGCFHLHLRDLLADLSQIGNAVYRIHLLHDTRLDIATPESVQTLPGQFGIVAGVTKQLLLGCERSGTPDQIPELLSSMAIPTAI